MAAYYGEQSVEGRAEYARLRIMLRDQPGGADDVIAALARLARKMRGKKNKRRRNCSTPNSRTSRTNGGA